MSIRSIVDSGRRLMESTFLDRARIQDRSMVPDGSGGRKEIFTERNKTVACRFVQPKDDEPTLQLDSVYGPTTMILEFPLGTIIHEGDRVRNFRDQSIWQVTRDVTVPSEISVMVRCGIRQVGV